MTREEMANQCDDAYLALPDPHEFRGLHAAAAELRKSCAGCKWFIAVCPHPSCTDGGGLCAGIVDFHAPADGSGFCHRWEAK